MKLTQYVVRSNVHIANLDTAINRLLESEQFIDVTLACDGHKFQCHRLVLAASSPLFEELLLENPSKHPIVILPIGIKAETLKSLIDFMYKGETNVTQTGLKELVESAELLQVTGLYDSYNQFRDLLKDEEYKSDSQEDSSQTKEQNTLHNEACMDQTTEEKDNDEHMYGKETDERDASTIKTDEDSYEFASLQKNQAPNETIVDVIEIEDSEDVPPINKALVFENSDNGRSKYLQNTKDFDTEEYNEPALANPITECTSLTKNDDENENILEKENINDSLNVPKVITSSVPTIRVKPAIKLINLFQFTSNARTNNSAGVSNNQATSTIMPWTYIHIPVTRNETETSDKNIQLTNSSQHLEPISNHLLISKPTHNPASVPSFLRFNSSSMAISMKNLDRTETQEKVNVLNMAMETETESEVSSTESHQSLRNGHYHLKSEHEPSESKEIELGEAVLSEADFPMFYAMIKKEREDQAARLAKKNKEAYMEAENKNETEAENIICQPNVSYIYDADDDGKDMDFDENEAGVCIDYDRLVEETYGNEGEYEKGLKDIQIKVNAPYQNGPKSLDLKLLSVSRNNQKQPPTLVPLSIMQTGLGHKQFHYHRKLTTKENGKSTLSKAQAAQNTEPNSPQREGEVHSPQTVILRNPRCNQPRHYSTESLYNALMAVKYGESIYRASRLHEVPRKTLRNWMKRWDIKSQYPMPKQLKDAAKKKKLSQIS